MTRAFLWLLCLLLTLSPVVTSAQPAGESPDEPQTAAPVMDPREQRPLNLDGDLGATGTATETAPTSSLPGASIGRYLLTVAVWLLICSGLIYGLVALMRWLYRRSPGAMASSLIEPLTVVPIAPGLALHVVRFHDELLLLGATGTSITLIERITDPERVAFFLRTLSPPPGTPNPAGFGAVLQRVQRQMGQGTPPLPRLEGATLFGPESGQAEREARVWLVGDDADQTASGNSDKLADLRQAIQELRAPQEPGSAGH